MKHIIVLLLVVLNHCNGHKIVKRFVNEENNSTNESLNVNVSAGYGVHSENTTIVTPSTTYQYPERKIQKENETMMVQINLDQIPQPSDKIEVLPSPSYQVHEKSHEVQEKNFQVGKSHRFRLKRYRHRNIEAQKSVNEEPMKHQQHEKIATAGTKIVEVLRVPAMYELHLQSDPQRLASLNTALLTKLINQNQYKKPVMQPFYHKNLIPQQSAPVNYQVPHPRFAMVPLKPRYTSQKLQHYGKVPQLQSAQSQNVGYKHNVRPPTYPLSTETPKKFTPSVTTQSPVNYPLLSNEISSDFYQKPQALHEVPAPVLNKQPPKYSMFKTQTTSVPGLVYGKPVDPPYQPSTQAPLPWGSVQDLTNTDNQNAFSQNSYSRGQVGLTTNSPMDQNGFLPGGYQYNKGQLDLPPINNQNSLPLNNYPYGRGQVESVPNYYQEQQQNKLNLVGIVGENGLNNYSPHNQDYYHPPHYQGHQNVQHYYNNAIGDHLDQTLVNVNGGVATYLNPDGTMTVSNFHHNPKLYRPPAEYDIQVNENQNEEVPPEYGLASYQNQQNNLVDFNNQMYSGYNEVSENQGSEDQNADLNNLLVGAASASIDEAQNHKFEPVVGHGRGHMTKRMMHGKSFGANRRVIQPMDYILYIKERRLE